MKKRKLFSFGAGILLAMIFLFGFSGNDKSPILLTPSSPSGDVTIQHGTLPDLIGAWTTGAPITTTTYFGGGVGYQRNDTGWVYILGGNGSASGIANMQRYNVNTNAWSTMAPMPQALRVNASAVLKDSVYNFGGVTSGGAYQSVNYRYDINSNTWTTRAPLTAPNAFGKAVGYQDSLIYVAGGTNGVSVYNNIRLYNALSNTWREATPMPGMRFGGAFTRTGDTLIYIGGADLSVLYSTTYVGVISQADRSVITWTTGATFPAGVMYRMDAHPWGNKGIIVTGGSATFAFTSISNVCYTYSPGTNTYTPQANKPTAWTCGQSGSVSFASGIWKLVCASGYNGASNITATEIFTDTLAVTPPPSTQNNSLLLPTPGVNTNYVGIPHQASMVGFGNNVTIEGWMRVGSFSTPNTLLNKGAASFDYQLGVNSTGIPFFRAQGVVATGTGVTVVAGVWTHLAVTYDGSTARFYKDGVLGATVPLAMTLGSSSNEMRIGRGGSDPGSGNIDEVRLWSVARSQSDISTDMCKKWPSTFVNTTGLKALWHMDSTYIDSISGYNGTPTTGSVGFDTAVAPCLVTGIVQNGTQVPERYYLGQNYPNPFNPTTTIRFEIPKQSLVTLKIYDISGREVGYLINEVKNAGVYLVGFNGANLASGTYFYRIQAGDFVEVKKMVLLK